MNTMSASTTTPAGIAGILIDPTTETITRVQCSGDLERANDLPGIYELLQCDTIDLVYLRDEPTEESMFIDDNGLLGDLDRQSFFMLGGRPIAGRGLVLGADSDGESIGTALSVAEIEQQVEFIDNHTARRRIVAQDEAARASMRERFGDTGFVIHAGLPSGVDPDRKDGARG
jgi:hypothetical protein